MSSGKNLNRSQRVKAQILKTSIVDALSVIGMTGITITILIEELKRQGMDMDNHNKSYSLGELEKLLLAIFGRGVTPLIMERIENRLRD